MAQLRKSCLLSLCQGSSSAPAGHLMHRCMEIRLQVTSTHTPVEADLNLKPAYNTAVPAPHEQSEDPGSCPPPQISHLFSSQSGYTVVFTAPDW